MGKLVFFNFIDLVVSFSLSLVGASFSIVYFLYGVIIIKFFYVNKLDYEMRDTSYEYGDSPLALGQSIIFFFFKKGIMSDSCFDAISFSTNDF